MRKNPLPAAFAAFAMLVTAAAAFADTTTATATATATAAPAPVATATATAPAAAPVAAAPVAAAPAPIPATAAPAARPAPPFDRAAWLQDYAQLKTSLERSYSHLAWAGSPQGGIDLPLWDRRMAAALRNATGDDDAKFAIRNFVAAFHDGHFSELPASTAGAAPSSEPPLRALDHDEAASGCAALGYGERSQVAFSLPFESLDGFKLLSDGAATAFRAGTIGAGGGSLGIVRIKNFSQSQYLPECLRLWKADPKLDPRAAEFGERVTAGWFETLAALLKGFRAAGVSAVIVDVGSNSGGNDSGDWAARLFTDRPVRSARLLMSASPDAAAYLDEEIGALHKADAREALKAPLSRSLALYESRKAQLAARSCDMSWVWRERRAYDPSGCSRLLDVGWASGAFETLPATAPEDRAAASTFYWPARVDAWRGAWTGPVYVLTNATSYSAAEMFAAVMKDNAIARTVGARTGGDGCGFMTEAVPLVLAHSHMRFRIANCVRLRADGSDEKAGIAPDLPVESRDGESPRGRAMRVLETISADMKR